MPERDDELYVLYPSKITDKMVDFRFRHGFEPQCFSCKHFDVFEWVDNDKRMCKAFDEVPDEIWQNKHDHKKPYPGDKGIQYLGGAIY